MRRKLAIQNGFPPARRVLSLSVLRCIKSQTWRSPSRASMAASMLSAVHTTRENPKIQVTTVHSSVATKTETRSPVRRRSAHPLPDLHISHAKQTRNQQTNGTRTQSKQSPQLALGIERSIDTLCQTKIGKSKTKGGFYFVSKNQVPKRNPKLAP